MVYVKRRDQRRFRCQTLQSGNRRVDRELYTLEGQQPDSGVRVRIRLSRKGH